MMHTSVGVVHFSLLYFLCITSTYSSEDSKFSRRPKQSLATQFTPPPFSLRRPDHTYSQGNKNGAPFGESRFMLNSIPSKGRGRLNSFEPVSTKRFPSPDITHSTAVTPFSDINNENRQQMLGPFSFKGDSEGPKNNQNGMMNKDNLNNNLSIFNYQQNQPYASNYRKKSSIENNSKDALGRLAAFSYFKGGRLTTTTTTLAPPQNAIEAASRSIGQSVDFGSSLVSIVFQVPQFIKLVENITDSFIPGGPKKEATNVLQALPEALVQLVDFFAKIHRTVDLGKQLEVSLTQTLLEVLNGPLLRPGATTTLYGSSATHTPQIRLDDVGEDSTTDVVLNSLYKVLGKSPEALPSAKDLSIREERAAPVMEFTGILAPINNLLMMAHSPFSVTSVVESVKDFVTMSSLFFETINTVVDITENAMDEMQVDRLVTSYRELLYDGKLAGLGIVADASPPEHLGSPSVSCVSQGMTCCVPHEAAGDYKQKPLYMQNMHRIECRGTFVSRSNMVCATAPYKNSRCRIIHGEAPGLDTYTAVIPLTGFATNAVCQCQVSKTLNDDDLHDMTGTAAWDTQGATSKSLLDSADKGWGNLKTFTKTGSSLVSILGLILDPAAGANTFDGFSKNSFPFYK